MKSLVYILPGLLFGLGLAVADMTNPAKVLNFLDLAGSWDGSLLFTMGGGVISFAVMNWFIHRSGRKPLLGGTMPGPRGSNTIDWRAVTGAAVFGIGWGLSGVCPGPALADASLLVPELLVYIGAMALAMVLSRRLLGTDSGPG